jgi:hypothetical protein
MTKKSESFELAISSFPADIQNIARAVRKMIYNFYPDVVEVVGYNKKILDLEPVQKK